jgi:beta-phosphoglucomutase
MAAKLLNIEPENSIVFEDSVAGVPSGRICTKFSIGIEQQLARSKIYL